MNYNEALNAIRFLANGCDPKFDISSYLEKHNCLYLLKIANSFNKNKYEKILWRNIINVSKNMTSSQKIISQIDFPYAVIKGYTLSYLSYNNPYLRLSCDVDFLIDKNNIVDFKKILIREGYIQGRVENNEIIPYTREEIIFQSYFSHQIPQFVKKTDSLLCPFSCIDINTSIMFGESTIEVDTSKLLDDVFEISISNCIYKTLSIEKGFISLCLHHFKDINSLFLLTQGSFNISLFCDIYFYLKNHVLSINKLFELCNELNVGRYIYSMLYYTNLLFNDELLDIMLQNLESFKDNTIFDTFGLNESELKKWDMNFYERLFHQNLSEYVYSQLSKEEKQKIKLNYLNM